MDKELLIMWGLGALIVAIVIAAIVGNVAEEHQWDTFAQAHKCVVVQRMKGETSVGVGTGITTSGKFGTGTIIVTNPDKTAYKCDDGITYWR